VLAFESGVLKELLQGLVIVPTVVSIASSA
jgi:hypothetical protein